MVAIFYENERSLKSLGTPKCIYIIGFIKIGPFLRKLEIWRYADFTHDVTAASLNVVNFQFSNGYIYKVS